MQRLPVWIRSGRSTALFVMWFLMSACGARQISPPSDMETDAVALLESTVAAAEQIRSARLRATLEYYGEGGRARVRQAVLVQAPNLVRIETISPLDTSLSVLVLNGESLVYYDIAGELYLMGEPTADHIGELIPLRLSPEDIVRVMVGGPPLAGLASDLSTATVEWNAREGWYDLRIPLADGGTMLLGVIHEGRGIAWVQERDARGREEWTLRGGDRRPVEGSGGVVEVPHRLRFRMREGQVDISLEVERYTVNPELSEELFSLDPPRGIEVRAIR
jgi:hypothetical protein